MYDNIIIIIIIIMKNFNIGTVPMVTVVAQSAANWCNTHTHMDHRSHIYINAVETTLCEAPAQLLQGLESNLI